MSESRGPVLVLGATGKTGSRVAAKLRDRGVAVRTAARSGADVKFDWDDPAGHRAALEGASGVYLLAPLMRAYFGPQVTAFLDLAEAQGVEHVTYLSADGMYGSSPEVGFRAVEDDLRGRSGLGYSILRPAWFMQNFSEGFLRPIDGTVAVPTGAGAEAFVDVDDIAAVAAVTLAEPAEHAGAEYTPTGPEALTFAEAAAIIGEASGRSVAHLSPGRTEWIDAILSTGVPEEYGVILETLSEKIDSGRGARPTGDVLKVTGSTPTSFEEFARRAAAAWSAGAEEKSNA